MAADPEYAAMMAERKAEYTRTRTAKRQAEREALVELAKTDEEAAKKLAEMRKYQSQATVRSYQKMKADAEAGDPDAIKRYETTLAKRRKNITERKVLEYGTEFYQMWRLLHPRHQAEKSEYPSWQVGTDAKGVSATG